MGRDRVSAVETSGAHILKTASLNLPKLAPQPLTSGSRPGEDLNLWVEAIRGFIKENKFASKEAVVGLSGKDLFIRGFQMPLLARREIDSGINFEVKKYLPFRTEDLVFDYQYRLNKELNKTDVFYVAANRNSFDKYLSLFKDSGIRVRSIEGTGLSLFRLLWLTRQLDPKQTIMIINIQDGSDLEFSVLSMGFPCFSREIKLSQSQPSASPRGEPSADAAENASPERLSSEIRVFLDYFKRQFSVNSVDKIIFVAKSVPLDLIADLNKNLGLNIQTLEQSGDAGLNALPDLDAFKAYAAALKGQVPVNLTADLFRRLSRQTVIISKEKTAVPALPQLDFSLFKRPLIFGLILIGLAYGFSLPEQMDAANNLRQIKSQEQESLTKDLKGLDLKALRAKIGEGRKKLTLIKDLTSSRMHIIPYFNLLPRSVQDGLWIEGLDISLKDKSLALRMNGISCLGDEVGESAAVKDFLAGFKNNRDLPVDLNNLEIVSIRGNTVGAHKMTVFEISGDVGG